MFLSAWLKSNIKIITVKNEGSLLIMKNRRMRLMAIFAAGVLSVTSMGGIVTAFFTLDRRIFQTVRDCSAGTGYL